MTPPGSTSPREIGEALYVEGSEAILIRLSNWRGFGNPA